ncbi:MAG: hypothetical protein BWY31_02933 [Lentisphaerae bacterium ADurb.Bin242]|nr:MAG: hypothetical protein BWY31_02933 [Lentisphaerae bacterium ADurb.Bin242]
MRGKRILTFIGRIAGAAMCATLQKKTFRSSGGIVSAAAVLLSAGFGGLSAEETAVFNHPSDWGNPKFMKVNEDGSLAIRGMGVLFAGEEMIEIDPAAESVLSGEFKAMPGTLDKDKFFFAAIPYDKNRKRIHTIEVNAIPGTDTVVVEGAKAGTREVFVKDASRFKNWHALMLHAAPDFSDLPNRSPALPIESVERTGEGKWKLTLKAPLKTDLPSGMNVRAHAGGAYHYIGCLANPIPKEWMTVTGRITGTKPGDSPTAWYPTTRFIRLAVFGAGPSKDYFLAFRNVKFTSKGGTLTAGAARTRIDLPETAGGAALRLAAGPEGKRIRLVWADGTKTNLTLLASGCTWQPPLSKKDKAAGKPQSPKIDLPDAVLELKGTGAKRFIRPNPEILSGDDAAKIVFWNAPVTEDKNSGSGDAAAKLVEGWNRLPAASKYEADLRFVKTGDGAEVWLDGNYGGTVRGKAPLKEIIAYDANVKHSLEERRESDFLPLDFTRINTPGKWDKADVFLHNSPGKVPVRVFANHHFDVSLHKSAGYSDYLRRYVSDGLADTLMFTVPGVHYTSARVLFAFDPDEPGKEPVLTARITRFSRGGVWDGRAVSRISQTPYRFDGKNAEKAGEVDVNGRKLPLYLAEIPLDTGKIQDLLNYDTCGEKNRLPYLDFEILGKVHERRHAFGDERCKPDPASKSSLHVFAVTLEKAGAEMFVRTLQPGNIFHNEEKPELAVDFAPRRKGNFKLEWNIVDADGKTVSTGSRVPGKENRLNLAQKEKGYYEITVSITENGRTRVAHTASFALLGKDTRQAGYESPYGSWWFHSAHHVTDRIDLAGPLLLKAGFRKTTFLNPGNRNGTNSEEALQVYKLTSTTLPGWNAAFAMFEKGATDAEVAEMLRKYMSAFPHVSNAMIFHESAKWGYKIAPEVLGQPPTPKDKEWEGADKRWENARRYAAIVKKNFPHIRILLGNSLSSTELIAEGMRRRFPQELADNMGMEVVGRNTLPELQWEGSLQSCEFMAILAKYYRYNWTPTSCFESNYRLDQLIGDKRQAVWYVRDMLVMHVWKFPDINIALLFDVANNYYHSFWGGSGLCQRMPYLYPKRAYVGVATLTRVLDRAELVRQVPTGSNSVYALEFKRKDGKMAYALWISCGDAGLQCDFPSSSNIEQIDFYGRDRKFSGKVTAGEAALYLVSDKPVRKITLAGRSYPENALDEKFKVAQKADNAADWTVVHEKDPRMEFKPGQTWLPCRTLGKYELRTVSDGEKGKCLEIELTPDMNLPEPFREYGVFRLKTPVTLDGAPHTIGTWVKGNSGWGRIFWELEDAGGRKFIACGGTADADVADYEGTRSVCFDGWKFIRFPITTKSPVVQTSTPSLGNEWVGYPGNLRYPLKLTAFGFDAPPKPLILTRRIPLKQVLRVRDIGTTE